MTSRKLRQDPPLYGYGRVIKSVKNQDVDKISLKLLKELKYHGFSEIEWKLDRRDGRYKLIEINARPIFYIGLCVRCGINFPYIQYLDLVRQKKIKIVTYKENIYWIHLYKDLLHTILHHKLEDNTFRDYIHPYLRKKVFAVLNFKDPLPFCQQWKQHIFNMIKKVSNRMLRN
jgi:predicted ATP-grasp superfamily ATP-dependent carboligase